MLATLADASPSFLRDSSDRGPRTNPSLVAYCLFVASLPFARPPLGTLLGFPVQISDVLLVALYLTATVDWIRGRIRRCPDPALTALAAAFVCAQLLSVLLGPGLQLRNVGKLAAYAALIFLVPLSPMLVQSTKDVHWLLRAWLLGVALTVVLGIVGLVGFWIVPDWVRSNLMLGYGALKPGPYPRLALCSVHPNMLANYLAIATPVALVALARWRVAARVCVAAGAALVGLSTLSTGFAGIAIGLSIAHRLWLPLRFRRPLRIGLFTATILATLVLTTATIATIGPPGSGGIALGERELRLWDGPRPSIWSGALQTFREHPWTGIGYGEYPAVTTDPRAFVPASSLAQVQGPVEPHRMEAHDVWLSVAGQSGVIGLGAFVALLASIIAPLVRRGPADATADDVAARLRQALLAGLAGGLLFHGLFAASEEARHLWALLGLCAIAVRRRR
ncbi:MAG: hypothetical protein D6689_21675 [Deltaproteobacteria bacterium]|nr:MAG: hypothetical protein D6689_21675 [Deltaproteobacteria bacterium]